MILGGGLSGLCSAFYLSRQGAKRKIVLLEKSDRFGGWVRSCTASSLSNDAREREVEFEAGPRSVRPVGLPGLLTLDLVRAQ